MRHIPTLKLLSALTLLQGCSVHEFDKAMTMRNYELYGVNIQFETFDEETGARKKSPWGLRTLPMRIADDGSWMDFTVDDGDTYVPFSPRYDRETPLDLEPFAEIVSACRQPADQQAQLLPSINKLDSMKTIRAEVILENGTNQLLLLRRKPSFIAPLSVTYALTCKNIAMMVLTAANWHRQSK